MLLERTYGIEEAQYISIAGKPPGRIMDKEVEIETYRSSGPGGQRRNKKETAVRIKHLPSGITATASERRSQTRNRDKAFERLQSKLSSLDEVEKPRIPTKPPHAVAQMIKEEKKQRSEIKRLRKKSTIEIVD